MYMMFYCTAVWQQWQYGLIKGLGLDGFFGTQRTQTSRHPPPTHFAQSTQHNDALP